MRAMPLTVPIAVCVFATGGAALVYEVVWQRYLHRLLGNDHTATAVTLAVFLAGLSLGYGLCGRLTTRVRNHVATYGWLEIAIGAWALAFPWLFGVVERGTGGWSFRPPWLLALQGTLVASVLLVPPALLMGATVPFLTRIAASTERSLTAVHALVYGVNTAGAVVGALAAGFWLVPTLGLSSTLARTAWLNLMTGVFLLTVAAFGVRGVPLTVPAAERPERPRFSLRTLSAIAMLSGMETMALENVLFRYVSLVFGGSALTFSLVVAAFVTAIALGAVAVSRVRRIVPATLWALQLGVAATLTGIWFFLDAWPYLAYLLRLGFGSTPVAFYFFHAAVLLFLLLLFAVPVGCLGAVIPVVFHEALPRLSSAGRTSGGLLSWNAAGNLVGSLAGGVLLYVWLDAAQVYLVVPLLASAGAWFAGGMLGRPARFASVTVGLIVAMLLVWQPTHDAERLALGTRRLRQEVPYAYRGSTVFFEECSRGRDFLFREDGPLNTVAVMATSWTHDDPFASRAVLINGRSNSDTRVDAITLRLSAHLPLLWADAPRHALVIGLGTGVTAGELTLHPALERIDVVEISPTVVQALPLFAPFTNGLSDDPRVHVHAEDAHALLRRNPRTWDVIISEPSHLWVAGNDTLFTSEFYRLVGQSLRDGGIFLQWVQLYDADIEIVGSIAYTLREEFPTIHAFAGTSKDLLLVASNQPLATDATERARRRLERVPRVRDSLALLGMHTIEDILAREQRTFGLIFEHPRGYRIHTLDHPWLAFRATLAAFRGSVVEESDFRGGADVEEKLWELERMLREDSESEVDADH